MKKSPALFLSFFLILSGCVGQEVLDDRLAVTLSEKGFSRHETLKRRDLPYKEKITQNTSSWRNANAILRYHQTCDKHYTYILSYMAYRSDEEVEDTNETQEDSDDEEDPPSTDQEGDASEDSDETSSSENILVQHFLSTNIIFPKVQNIRIRYYTKAPLLFEWISNLSVCGK